MPRPPSEHPTELELQILDILWEESPLTVREVRDGLSANGRELAHTSVITTMSTMVEKGQLKKLEPISGKAFRFAPSLSREEISKGILGDVVERVFDGSAEAVMMSLFDVKDLDVDEIKRLRKLLNQKMREQDS